MKAIKNIGIVGISLALLLGSCSVEKRRYRPGYSVNTDKKAPTEEPSRVSPPLEEKYTIILPEYAVPPASKEDATQINTGYTNAYSIYVKVGPRPDKKGKKKYPMGM